MPISQDEYIKDALVSDIQMLGATDLELIAKRVLTNQTDKPLQTHGINLLGRPVKNTVDGRSPDSDIAFECSVEKGYFNDKNYNKIFHDIAHAVEQNPSNHKLCIFLVSSQLEPPSFRKDYLNAVAEFLNKKGVHPKIELYAARSLADLIYEEVVLQSGARDYYLQFFPQFAQVLAIHSYFGLPPSHCHRYVMDGDSMTKLKNHFMQHVICVLHGLSGSGKTETAIEFAYFCEKNGYNLLWMSGEDWPQNSKLASVKQSRAGSRFNITGIFNQTKTLLVIDNLNWPCIRENFAELEPGFSIGSKVLVTTQIESLDKSFCLPMPEISEECASSILGEKAESLTEKAKHVLKKCRFLPLRKC